MDDSWYNAVDKLAIDNLMEDVNNERTKHKGNLEIYPKNENIFRCFNYFKLPETRVVIIGQDPYHGPNQANGLAFAVEDNIKKPPSLKNIEKELGKTVNIEEWAKQGVLMLNTSLTVPQSCPGNKYHINMWRPFTKQILDAINVICEGVVFVAWGAFAMNFLKDVDMDKHTLVITSHPSPLSANKKLKTYPAFIGSKVFETINTKLKKKIEW